METLKTRKMGDSVVITLPAASGGSAGEEFYSQRSDNGIITLVPKIRDYFEHAKENEFRQPLEWEELYIPQGIEEIE